MFRNPFCLAAVGLLLAAPHARAAGAKDIVLADFEEADYGTWQATGDAFGRAPARGTLARQQSVSGFLGAGLVNTYLGGDGATGTLTSSPFAIQRRYIRFLIGGGNHPGKACVELLVDGKVVRTATGGNNERLEWLAWSVGRLRGKTARIRIADRITGGWGHVNVDQIVQSDRSQSSWPARMLAAREAFRAAPAADRNAREAAARRAADEQWRQVARQFPALCEAMAGDLARGPREWFAQTGRADVEPRMIRKALGAAEPFGAELRAALEALARSGASTDDEAWLELYVDACALRDATEIYRAAKDAVAAGGPAAGEMAREMEGLIRRKVPLSDPRWAQLRNRGLGLRLTKFGVTELIFAVRKVDGDGHWYANFGTWSNNPRRTLYHEGGRLCRLNLATGKVTNLIDDPTGGVRDPQMHYDGRKILLSYRKGGQPYYHLYEIGIDGKGLRQLTDGLCDDVEPTYLPDGGIAFCSSRCNRMVQCYYVRVAVIYRCDADGSNIRQLSGNLEQDNTPWVLPDGRILHQRWEYIDRSQVQFHHLWTMNPDGTGQMVYFGNMYGGNVLIDAKPIPARTGTRQEFGTEKIVLSWSPGHGQKEHAGFVTILDSKRGPDDLRGVRRLTTTSGWRDPYPLSEDCFLVARETEIRVMDGQGNHTLLYALPDKDRSAGMKLHEPRPLRSRPRERVIASRVQPAEETGRVILHNVYRGRNMAGIRPGEIKKLLVLEALPKPVNFSGAQEPLSMGGTFTMERILGTVPVEADGSAYFELPALRSLFFVALDENDLSVKRMQSFLAVQPGETFSCVGCHEQRTRTTLPRGYLTAARRAPSKIEPIADVPDVIDFPRDIQPILDRHCVACHGYDKTARGGPRAGGVILTGDRGPWYSHSYVHLTRRGQFSDGRNGGGNRPPRAIGSSASPLIKKIAGEHHNVKASALERRMIRLWIESAAAYPGTYAALGSGMVQGTGRDAGMRKVFADRCATCHKGRAFDEHTMYNLTRPEKSMVLLAPLAPSAGGYGMPRKTAKDGKTVVERLSVFQSTRDPGYQAILAGVRKAKDQLDRIKRFDMPGFVPNEHYVREMKFYGVLRANWQPGDPIDVYKTDQAYWRSLWHRPDGE